MRFKLALIRHGKTVANEKKVYCGLTDLSLTKKGREEILGYAREDIYPKSQTLFSSGMKRADETLKLIYGENAPFHVVEGLREIDLGHIEMKSYDELKEKKDYIAWISDKTGFVPCPGGESKNEFEMRIKLAFFTLTEEMKKLKAPDGVLVTHGGVIAALLEGLFPGRQNFYDWQPKPGLGYILSYMDSGYANAVKISTENNKKQ